MEARFPILIEMTRISRNPYAEIEVSAENAGIRAATKDVTPHVIGSHPSGWCSQERRGRTGKARTPAAINGPLRRAPRRQPTNRVRRSNSASSTGDEKRVGQVLIRAQSRNEDRRWFSHCILQ